MKLSIFLLWLILIDLILFEARVFDDILLWVVGFVIGGLFLIMNIVDTVVHLSDWRKRRRKDFEPNKDII